MIFLFGNTNLFIQNLIPTLRQSSIIFEKLSYLSEKLKTLTSRTATKFNIFCRNFAQASYKVVWNLFTLFRSWVLKKNVKNKCVETRSFFIFASNTRSKQIKKNPKHPFVDIGKWEMCAKFQQKILNSIVVEATQSFLFFSYKKPGFLKIKELCLNFHMGFCIS